jgi:hypothetical protein
MWRSAATSGVEERHPEKAIADLPRELALGAERLVGGGHRRQPQPDLRPPGRDSSEKRGVLVVVERPAPRPRLERRLVEREREERVELRRRVDCRDARQRCRFLVREPVPVPMLADRIRRPDEQEFPPGTVARHQDEDGVGLRDAGEV